MGLHQLVVKSIVPSLLPEQFCFPKKTVHNVPVKTCKSIQAHFSGYKKTGDDSQGAKSNKNYSSVATRRKKERGGGGRARCG